MVRSSTRQVCARHVAGRLAYLLPDGLTKVRWAGMPHVFIPLQANVF